ETLTDQHIDAWFDSTGGENSDKCAWAFGTPLLSFSNKSQWKIQGNWSNRAFDTNTGYPNRSGQNGCIDGGNFRENPGSVRSAFRQPIELHADVRRFRRRVGERNGAIERVPCFLVAPQLLQQGAPQAEEIKIARQLSRERLDHRQSRLGPPHLRHRDRAVERDHRRRLQPLEGGVECVDLVPVGVLGPG